MSPIDKLLDVMVSLRHPETGCIWDKEQTYKSIVPYTIEEVYEVAEVIETEDYEELKNELGDLLFQVVFYAQIAKEEKRFDFNDVVEAISEKMIRRHPHVFSGYEVKNVQEQKILWDEIKKKEKPEAKDATPSALDGVNYMQPAVAVARKLQSKAAKVGFDWPDHYGTLDKIHEEMEEVKEAVDTGDIDKITDEVGDVLFAAVNLARKLGVDPDVALRSTNRTFDHRFKLMEQMAADEGSEFKALSLDEQENLWGKVKKKSQ